MKSMLRLRKFAICQIQHTGFSNKMYTPHHRENKTDRQNNIMSKFDSVMIHIFENHFAFFLQCETMGLQATSPPTSPLHRPPAMLKRKHDLVEDIEDEDSVLMAMTTGSGVKKICVEVVCAERSSRLKSTSDEELEDYSDEDSSSSSSGSHLDDESMMVSSSNASGDEENKENQINLNKLNKGELDSILAKTLLNTPAASSSIVRYVSDLYTLVDKKD